MRNWILAVAAVGVLGGATLVGVGMTRDDAPGALPLAGVFKDASPTPAASPTPTGPSPEELRKIERAKQVKALDAALKKYAKTVPEFSVAVDRKSTRLNSSHANISYAVFCLKKKNIAKNI